MIVVIGNALARLLLSLPRLQDPTPGTAQLISRRNQARIDRKRSR